MPIECRLPLEMSACHPGQAVDEREARANPRLDRRAAPSHSRALSGAGPARATSRGLSVVFYFSKEFGRAFFTTRTVWEVVPSISQHCELLAGAKLLAKADAA